MYPYQLRSQWVFFIFGFFSCFCLSFCGLFLKLYIFCIFVLIRDFTILLNVVISFFLSCWDQIFPPFLAVFIIFTRNLSLSSLVLSYLTKLIKIKPMLSSPPSHPHPAIWYRYMDSLFRVRYLFGLPVHYCLYGSGSGSFLEVVEWTGRYRYISSDQRETDQSEIYFKKFLIVCFS